MRALVHIYSYSFKRDLTATLRLLIRILISFKVMATKRETGRGLGYGAVSSIDMSHETSKSLTWKKTQDRYNAIGRGRAMTSSQGPVSLSWVKKASKPETVDIFADDT